MIAKKAHETNAISRQVAEARATQGHTLQAQPHGAAATRPQRVYEQQPRGTPLRGRAKCSDELPHDITRAPTTSSRRSYSPQTATCTGDSPMQTVESSAWFMCSPGERGTAVPDRAPHCMSWSAAASESARPARATDRPVPTIRFAASDAPSRSPRDAASTSWARSDSWALRHGPPTGRVACEQRSRRTHMQTRCSNDFSATPPAAGPRHVANSFQTTHCDAGPSHQIRRYCTASDSSGPRSASWFAPYFRSPRAGPARLDRAAQFRAKPACLPGSPEPANAAQPASSDSDDRGGRTTLLFPMVIQISVQCSMPRRRPDVSPAATCRHTPFAYRHVSWCRRGPAEKGLEIPRTSCTVPDRRWPSQGPSSKPISSTILSASGLLPAIADNDRESR